MRIILTYLLPLCFVIGFGQSGGATLYIDFNDVKAFSILDNPRNFDGKSTLHLDNVSNMDYLQQALISVADKESIESIIITDFEGKKIPQSLANCKYLRKVTFVKCREINARTTIKLLGELPALESINFGNCQIDAIPPEIKNCTQLRSINISLNNVLDLRSSIEALAECPNLETVALPVNQISELPNNIGKLTHLKELNLANNNLTDLPDGLRDLDSLESIAVQKNIIIGPVKAYQKLNTLNIKYLSIDAVTDDELEELKKLFPNAEIKQEEKPNIELLEMHTQLKDSIKLEILSDNHIKDESYVIKKRESTELKVYSMAYLQYAKVFDPLIKKDEYRDTLLFDERFLDTNYYNIYRRQIGLNYDYFELKMAHTKQKNQIAFDFKISEYFYTNFEEYFAFNEMIWLVVDNSQSASEFKREWIKNQQYLDFRIDFQSELKNFLLTLKTNDGFKTLTVVPRYDQKKATVSSVQSSYEVRYIKYLEGLNKRRKTFNKLQYEKLVDYRLKLNRLHEKAWDDFKKQNFSAEEASWSQEEWLLYYDEVISKEKAALLNGSLNTNYLERILFLSEIDELKSMENIHQNYGDTPSKIHFTGDKEEVGIKQLYVINHTDKTYKNYKGSNAPMDFFLFYNASDDLSIVAELRNGNLAVLEHWKAIKVLMEEPLKLNLTVMAKEYSDMYDIIKLLKLL